jgi:hypothetical protein
MLSNPAFLMVALIVGVVLLLAVSTRAREPHSQPAGARERSAKVMQISAALVALGILLLIVQVAFSDGARPNLVSLPIGIFPLQLGVIALLLGLCMGVARGTPRYRAAMAIGVFGCALVFLGFLPWCMTCAPSTSPPTISLNQIYWLGAAASWAIAVVLGWDALRRSARPSRDAR